MIKKESIIPLLSEFIGEDYLNIHGLIVTPIKVDGLYDIVVKISNPNDVSYYLGAADDEMLDVLGEFGSYIGANIGLRYERDPNMEYLYFNKKLDRQIKSIFNKITTLYINTDHLSLSDMPELNKYDIKIVGHSIGYDKEYDSDRIIIYNNFVPSYGALIDRETNDIVNTDLKYILSLYHLMVYSETSFESDHVYNKLDSLWVDNPLMGSGYIAYYYHTTFV